MPLSCPLHLSKLRASETCGNPVPVYCILKKNKHLWLYFFPVSTAVIVLVPPQNPSNVLNIDCRTEVFRLLFVKKGILKNYPTKILYAAEVFHQQPNYVVELAENSKNNFEVLFSVIWSMNTTAVKSCNGYRQLNFTCTFCFYLKH
jgi:hypothetical protein